MYGSRIIPINENIGVTIVTKNIPTEKYAVVCKSRLLLMYMSGKADSENWKKSAISRPEEYFMIVVT